MQTSLPSIRLRTSFGFWIMALLPGTSGGLPAMVTWAAIIFGSVLLPELGHALAGLLQGRRALIVLHSLGGRTELEPPLPARRRVVSTMTGPLVSLLAGVALFIVRRAMPSPPPWLTIAMWVNVGWGVLNILPIIPFDCGGLLMERLGKRRPTAALLISVMTSSVASTVGVVTIRNIGFTVLFVSVAIRSLFELGKVHDQIRTQLTDAQLGAARLAVLQHRYPDAIRLSEVVLGEARDLDTRNAALTILAWACLGEGRPRAAMAALEKVLPRDAADPYTLAAIQRASGLRDQAIETLQGARRIGPLSREAARLLVDLYAERGDLERAFVITLEHLRVLGSEDARLVVRALEQAEDFRHAARLSEAIDHLTAA
jgi:hypothetical protein